jgi:plasmid maintenance system antidote protein VapI
MSKNKKRQAQRSQTEQRTLLQYEGNKIAIEMIDGKLMVNATQMSKHFGKKPETWIKTQQFRDLQEALSTSLKSELNDLLIVRNGGINRGTWMHEDLALCFAQWLSAPFYLACNRRLRELHQKEVQGSISYYEEKRHNELEDLLNRACVILGSSCKLAGCLGVSNALLSHIRNRPHIVSEVTKQKIESFCQIVITEGATYIPDPQRANRPFRKGNRRINDELLLEICRIEDGELRMSIMEKVTNRN